MNEPILKLLPPSNGKRQPNRFGRSFTARQLQWLDTTLKLLLRGGDARVMVRAKECGEVLRILTGGARGVRGPASE